MLAPGSAFTQDDNTSHTRATQGRDSAAWLWYRSPLCRTCDMAHIIRTHVPCHQLLNNYTRMHRDKHVYTQAGLRWSSRVKTWSRGEGQSWRWRRKRCSHSTTSSQQIQIHPNYGTESHDPKSLFLSLQVPHEGDGSTPPHARTALMRGIRESNFAVVSTSCQAE